MKTSSSQWPELTFRGILLGAILTIILTASNVYLGLKVGLTFSSSIPAAVISMAVLGCFKNSNILENNMVQTQVSAAGTLSSVIFVIPGLFIVGYWTYFPFYETLMICLCGGILGVLFTIPLRRAMVVETKLAYPEGRAAAEILKIAQGESREGVKELSLGTILAAITSFLTGGVKLASDGISIGTLIGKMTFVLSAGYSVALLGAGYLVGIAGAIALLVGMLIAWGVLVPYFSYGVPIDGHIVSTAMQIWAQKVRLIGTGTIAIAAIWTLLELSKSVLSGILALMHHARNRHVVNEFNRTEQDLSFKAMLGIFLVVFLVLMATFYSFIQNSGLGIGYQITFTIVGTLLVVLIGFFVAAACGYMAGLVGSSSSPISGIGLIAIISSSLIFLAIGHDLFSNPTLNRFAIALALFTTSVILATAAISNDNLQDLKTGQLVGATPWRQQVALIIGCLFGALAITPVLNLLYQAYGFVGAMPRPDMNPDQALAAPQAVLMSTIAKGIFSGQIAWGYILFGILIGVIVIVIDKVLRRHPSGRYTLPPLAIGIGIYLPASVNIPLVVGGIFAFIIHGILRKRYIEQDAANTKVKQHEQRGTLFASGLIVGESIIGVIIAGITVISVSKGGSESPLAMTPLMNPDVFGFLLFIVVLAIFAWRIAKRLK